MTEPTGPTDDELAALFREGLERRATGVDAAEPLVGRARADARRATRGRWTILAAAAAVVAVAATALALRPDDTASFAPTTQPSASVSPSTAPDPVEQVTRDEYWHGGVVSVPADWGWGPAPRRAGDGDDNLYVCGDTPEAAYVGRPVMASDLCVRELHPPRPSVPSVWLGVDLPAGTQDLGGGWERTTVEVADTTVTVTTDDPAQRRQILDSVVPQDLCAPSQLGVPSGRFATPTPPTTTTLCAYRRADSTTATHSGNEAGATWQLVYARELSEGEVDRMLTALDASPSAGMPRGGYCTRAEFVAITTTYDPPFGYKGLVGPGRREVFDLDCRTVDVASAAGFDRGTGPLQLTDASVTPWADAGIRATLSYFIGPLG